MESFEESSRNEKIEEITARLLKQLRNKHKITEDEIRSWIQSKLDMLEDEEVIMLDIKKTVRQGFGELSNGKGRPSTHASAFLRKIEISPELEGTVLKPGTAYPSRTSTRIKHPRPFKVNPYLIFSNEEFSQDVDEGP